METNHNTSHTEQAPRRAGGIKNFFKVGEVLGYFFRGKDPSRPSNFNLKMMHGINKISIIVFLLGVLFLIIKRLG